MKHLQILINNFIYCGLLFVFSLEFRTSCVRLTKSMQLHLKRFIRLSKNSIDFVWNNKLLRIRSPLTLSNGLQNLFCFDFIPVFQQTFPNLNKLSLYFMDNQLNLDHYANFASSYERLDLLYITVGVHSEIENSSVNLTNLCKFTENIQTNSGFS